MVLGEIFHQLQPGMRVAFRRGRVWKFGVVLSANTEHPVRKRVRMVFSYENRPIWKFARFVPLDVAPNGAIIDEDGLYSGMAFQEVFVNNKEYI